MKIKFNKYYFAEWFFIISFIFLSIENIAQEITIVETHRIKPNLNKELYFPHFSSDDSKILFSTSNYKGLYYYELESGKTKTITEGFGAGYKPLILSADSPVIFKTDIYDKGRKYGSIHSFNFATEQKQTLELNKRRVVLPDQVNSNSLKYLLNSELKQFMLENKLEKSNIPERAVYVEDDRLFLIEGNEVDDISPFGSGPYVWESISNDGNKILFTYGNQGAYLIDFEGEVLLNIPEAHYPKLSPNGKFILYMKDEDDGNQYTASDIFIYSIENEESYPITSTEDKIEMFAEWSHKGDQIVYHTLDGEIFLVKLKIEM